MINKYIIFTFAVFFCLVTQGAPSCESFLIEGEKIPHYMNNAKKSFTAHNYMDAKEWLKKILDYDRDDYRALSLLSRIYFNDRDFDQAYLIQQRAIEAEPIFNEPSHYSMVQILLAMDRKDEAVVYANLILENNPTSSSVLGIVAGIYLFQNKLGLANDVLEIKKEVDGNGAHYLRLRAEYFLRKQEPQLALSFANQLINNHTPRKNQTRVPNAYRIGLILRSKIFILLERYDDALNDILLVEGFFTTPSNWIALIKAEIYFRKGKIVESRGILNDLVHKSSKLDLDVIAGLVSIENEGSSTRENPLLNRIFENLSHQDVLTTLKISRENNWIYIPPLDTTPKDYRISNSFWRGLNNIAINTLANWR